MIENDSERDGDRVSEKDRQIIFYSVTGCKKCAVSYKARASYAKHEVSFSKRAVS